MEDLHYAGLAERQAVVFHSRTSHARSFPLCLTIIDHLVFILQNLQTRPDHWIYSPIFVLHLIMFLLWRGVGGGDVNSTHTTSVIQARPVIDD